MSVHYCLSRNLTEVDEAIHIPEELSMQINSKCEGTETGRWSRKKASVTSQPKKERVVGDKSGEAVGSPIV